MCTDLYLWETAKRIKTDENNIEWISNAIQKKIESINYLDLLQHKYSACFASLIKSICDREIRCKHKKLVYNDSWISKDKATKQVNICNNEAIECVDHLIRGILKNGKVTVKHFMVLYVACGNPNVTIDYKIEKVEALVKQLWDLNFLL